MSHSNSGWLISFLGQHELRGFFICGLKLLLNHFFYSRVKPIPVAIQQINACRKRGHLHESRVLKNALF